MSKLRFKITQTLSFSEKTTDRMMKIYIILIYSFLYAPIAVIVVYSFAASNNPAFPISDFSLKWYKALIPPEYDTEIIGSLYRSIKLGIVTALVTGTIGTLAAIGMVRGNFKRISTTHLNVIFTFPLVVPYIVMGISMMIVFNFVDIYGTFLSLVIGHTLFTLPYVVLIVSGQLYNFNESVEEAARNLGASKLRTLWEVTLPIIQNGIFAGMLFAFGLSIDNFTQTFFWAGQSYQTLPVVIFSRVRYGLTPIVNSISTIILVFTIIIFYLAERLVSYYR